MTQSSLRTAAAALAFALSAPATADEIESWNAKLQSTYIWQGKPSFPAAYSGPNSLSPERATSYSFTATAALGWRPWSGGELYFDAELSKGKPLSNLTGLGGLTNGDMLKTGGSKAVIYRPRAFWRQTWPLGEETEPVESGFNQLGGTQPARRIVLTAGNLAVTDLFDPNPVAHDARTQFLNWALLTHGAYDFAADARGYTWGAALELVDGDWSVRAGRFAEPKESNGLSIDSQWWRQHGDQLEVAHRHRIADRPGALRLLVFRNVARMASFDDALAEAAATGGVPDIARVRRPQSKQGFGVAMDQGLLDDVTAFVRVARHDGRTEPYSFTSIDESFSTGASMGGGAWGRGRDQLALAYARHGLSPAHRRYLAAGGTDFFLGDGALRYAPETLVEATYTAALAAHLWLAFDVQHIANPAYNADRGPVRAFAVRLHAEY
ncbi:MAG: carbohydrate porin [Rhizobacter sp.]